MAVTETPGYRLVKGSMLYFLYCAVPSAADPPVGRPYQRVRGPATFPDPPVADVPVDESDEQAASAAVTAVAPARPRKPRRLNAAPEVERFFMEDSFVVVQVVQVVLAVVMRIRARSAGSA